MSSPPPIRRRTRGEPPAAQATVPAAPAIAPTTEVVGAGRDYAVGYGKPPRGRPFAPGQSGNPRGRPKAAKSFHTLLEAELNATVVVRENGREMRMSKRQVAARRLANKLAEGDPKALAFWLREADRRRAEVDQPASASSAGATIDELAFESSAVLAELAAMARRAIAGEAGDAQ